MRPPQQAGFGAALLTFRKSPALSPNCAPGGGAGRASQEAGAPAGLRGAGVLSEAPRAPVSRARELLVKRRKHSGRESVLPALMNGWHRFHPPDSCTRKLLKIPFQLALC